MRMKVVNQSLVEAESEGLIVPAGDSLDMSSSTAEDIRDACDGPVYTQLQRDETPEEGDVVVTDGFNLSSYFFHTVTTPGYRTRTQNVRMALAEALTLADRLGCQSLATPTIGSGFGGLNATVVTKIIGETVSAYKPTYLSEVQLNCINHDTYKTAKSVCSRDQSPWVAR